MFLEPYKGPAKDKKYVPSVDCILVRPARRGRCSGSHAGAAGPIVGSDGGGSPGRPVVFNIDGDLGALDQFEQGLLDAFPADITTICGFSPCDLVELV